MNGIELLTRVKLIVLPKTVRMMLTGNSDPDKRRSMRSMKEHFSLFDQTVSARADSPRNSSCGSEQYRLITAEKQLLEQTLSRSLQVLLDILSIVNPTAFNRSVG